MQHCDFQNLCKQFLNEFNEGACTMKLGRLFHVLVTLIVKLNLRKSYLGLWVSSLRPLPIVVCASLQRNSKFILES